MFAKDSSVANPQKVQKNGRKLVTIMSWQPFLDFGLSWLTSLQFILCHVAGFHKPTIPQSLPSHLWDYSTCNNDWLEFELTLFLT
jgi:hypothetical protein